MRCALVTLLLTLTACANARGPWDCESYGVRVTHAGLGQLASVSELRDSDIERICGPGKSGCTTHYVDTARVYYRAGDNWTLRHELCHVMHGEDHT